MLYHKILVSVKTKYWKNQYSKKCQLWYQITKKRIICAILLTRVIREFNYNRCVTCVVARHLVMFSERCVLRNIITTQWGFRSWATRSYFSHELAGGKQLNYMEHRPRYDTIILGMFKHVMAKLQRFGTVSLLNSKIKTRFSTSLPDQTWILQFKFQKFPHQRTRYCLWQHQIHRSTYNRIYRDQHISKLLHRSSNRTSCSSRWSATKKSTSPTNSSNPGS